MPRGKKNTANIVPKEVTNDTIDQKKRGRKPKDKVMAFPEKNNKQEVESENIIIHLPIKTELIKQNIMDGVVVNNDDIVPGGYEMAGADNYQFIDQRHNPFKNKINNDLIGEGQKPQSSFCSYPFDEKQKDIFDLLENEDDNGKDDKSVENINLIDNEYSVNHSNQWYKGKDADQKFIDSNKNVDKIMDYIKKQREIEYDTITNKVNKNTVEKCLIQLDECNRNNNWPSSSSIYCWWCCHPFSGAPCSLPVEYKNNTFHVLGIFCSPECAAAYNFDDHSAGCDLWERYSLLNFLYRKVYSDKHIKIKLAPPRQTLKIFGGSLSIKEFRQHNTNYEYNYRIIMPPMTSVIPVQEISSLDKGFSSKNEKRGSSGIDKVDNSLKLKRTKPINNSNTLDKCMLLVGEDTVSNMETESYM